MNKLFSRWSIPFFYILTLSFLILNVASCDLVDIVDENQAPTASFTVDPESGSIQTIFTFDASGSSDLETSASSLQVRWDWENDGAFDTYFSTTKSVQYQFTQAGTYTVLLEVKDEKGLSDTITKEINVTSGGVGGDGTYSDSRDGNEYDYKTIGTQTWMTENMAYLPSVSPSSSESASSPYYYVFAYEGVSVSAAKATDNYKDYGVLYNWEAAKLACPAGWHLPSDEEWNTLEIYLGLSESQATQFGYRTAGEVGKKLKSESMWYENGNGDNSSGFNVLPAGYLQNGFAWLGKRSFFWTSSSLNSNYSWRHSLDFGSHGVGHGTNQTSNGFSVRCLMD